MPKAKVTERTMSVKYDFTKGLPFWEGIGISKARAELLREEILEIIMENIDRNGSAAEIFEKIEDSPML